MAENTRSCASCGTANEEDARFCDGCGGSLARVCGTCGVEARAQARFCRGCGGSLDAAESPAAVAAGPVRKTVTVMFADLAGSTSFEERVDAETAREVIGRYHDLLRSTAQRHRAGVTKYIGDGFMSVWGVPETGPDDAGHAVDAAIELQDRFVDLAARVVAAHGVELALRVAVNTGEVVIGEGDADIVGDALNVAARLEAECPRGQVVVGEETWRSTRGQHRYDALGQVQVKGRTTPVAVFQWLGRQAEPAEAAPFVGRADEVRRLQSALDDATGARAARMVTVIGDPGVGKTRLAGEFVTAQPSLRVIRTRCNVEETVALAPIVELLRSRDLDADVPVGTPERDRMLRDLKGLADGVPGSVEETFWALRRFVEALAHDGPLLVVLDDVQWADALLLDFVEHLVEWVSEVPVLVVALARPELREVRPDFVTVGRWVTQAVHLGGLGPAATAELAAEVLGGARLPQELLRRLPSSTGGNPLFVRELIGMLVDDEVLVEEPAGWRLTIDVDAITIPPTIHALLASRLERLDAVDRRVLEIASVFGTDFSLGAVSVLAGRGETTVKPSLDRLRRLQLAQPSGAYVGDEPVWRFHHVLIRDVAYRRLLKSDRAALHERLADWVEAGGATLASDPDEMVARHLESAHGYRLDLGTLDAGADDLALRSARCYLASARRALDRDELVSAGTQAARGALLASADDGLRAELLLVGCEAFLSAGDVVTCAPLVDDLERVAGEMLAPWATCYRCQFVVYTDPERLLEVDARLQDAIDEFGRRKDAAGLAKARRVRAGARARLGRVGDCETDLLEALIAARQSGDQRQITAALSAAPSAALWGPSPVPKAGGRCLDVVRMQRMATAAPSLEATSLRCLAVLELLRGRPDKARSMLADARQVVADLGLRHGLMETELFAGIIESMVGDPVAAEPHFRAALEGLGALGVGADAGLAAALLARSLLAQGQLDGADGYAAESERLAGHNLKTAIAWRAVRAEILCAQGSYDEAVALARDAVAIADGTDLVLDHADACLALSRVLTTAGDARGANAARRDAEALYAAKEVVASIGQTVEPAVTTPLPTPAVLPTRPSRLARTNRASKTSEEVDRAMVAHDVDAAVAHFSDGFVYDDRRTWSGEPIRGVAAWRAGLERIMEQYSHFETRSLAVRGEHLELLWVRMSDDSGNETVHLHVFELDDDGRFAYLVRFDDDDLEAACRELDRRYYASEGAAFTEVGAVATEFIAAYGRGDFDKAFGELTAPQFRLENRSSSVLGDRSVGQLRASVDELSAMVSSARSWLSAICWVSPNWVVVCFEREAVGLDGEHYSWTRLGVSEVRDGRIASMCTFDLDHEDEAFAYAEERVRATTSRLAVTNRATNVWHRIGKAMAAHDVDAMMACISADRFVQDDRRGLSGDPIESSAALRAAAERVFEQYSHFDARLLAVRGECLVLSRIRWSDDAGNETVKLQLCELGDDGLIAYDGRFDEDDFEGAYRELDRRYYAGEGAAFAEGGALATESIIARNRGDLDRVWGDLASPGVQFENRSRSVFGDRSAAEVRASNEELDAMVTSTQTWYSVVCWLSPTCGVTRMEREAVGQDGERYAWAWIYAAEARDGRLTSTCQFDIDDEEAAFAYAEELMRATTASRLAVNNHASEMFDGVGKAMAARDVDAAFAYFSSDRIVYDDHRGLSGNPVAGGAAWQTAIERVLEQYSQFGWRTLAVRGERLSLGRTRWSDDAGNETVQLHVYELGDDAQILYAGRFDADDVEGAFRELEQRYYAGEGTAFAQNGAVQTEWMAALNRGDFDRVFGELTAPEFRLESRSGTVFGDRSAAEVLTSFEELAAMVASVRGWISAICWLSTSHSVSHFEREAVGLDGEQYAWTRLTVNEVRDGRVIAMCDFDPGDEDAAFAYAEERVRATTSRLAVANRASETWDRVGRATQAHDVDALAECCSDRFVYDDRRGLSGDPIQGVAALKAAAQRIHDQYSHFEGRTLAVRGERLVLGRTRWSDDAGNETVHLHVDEIYHDGRIACEVRFDEDDFEGAYRELEQRYYAGEGAAFAAGVVLMTEYLIAWNRGELDKVFGELTAPDFRFTSRSRSVFGDRSATEYRASVEELAAMVASVRGWISAVRWLSPACCAARVEREAVGLDGEQYSWTKLYVGEIRDGRFASAYEFEVDDEDEAFAYADSLAAAQPSRLAVTNRATEALAGVAVAGATRDVDAMVACYSADRLVYDDRRGVSGDPIQGVDALRAAAERVLEQYSHFDGRILAVRGERLALFRARRSDDAGNETVQLFLEEVGDDGLICYEGRFDEDDFEGAYRELEQRYYDDEGAAFAAGGAVATDYTMALNRGDLDQVFSELTASAFRRENRSRSLFGDRSAAQMRASTEELSAMVASAQGWLAAMCWLSPICCVSRFEREAVGLDGERYAWTRLLVAEVRDGRVTSMCDFDPDDEDAAFAYAEERLRATASRLTVTNQATEVVDASIRALRARDVDAVVAYFSDRWVYDDRRGLSGEPVASGAAARVALERILRQYPHVDGHTLAVRGERLALGRSRWSDDAGNEATYLHVHELGADGRIACEVRFDEDDFEGAYRELEQRYYAGEGAAFDQSAAVSTDYIMAVNGGDFDRAFGELIAPEFRYESRSRSVFGGRSAAELRTSVEELSAMVASSREWLSAVQWPSPACCVVRMERDAVGLDGEQYAWTRLNVCDIRDGMLVSLCEFDVENEQEAFAYAEELVRASTSRLPVSNRATEVAAGLLEAFRARNVDAAVDAHSDQFVYDDRRRLTGDPLVGRPALRAAHERVFNQFSVFDGRTLAVRGERLQLSWSRWSDDAGNETTNVHVFELGDDGRISYHGRFEEEDFEGAYRELEQRYYAGEGKAFAEGGAVSTENVIALNRGEFERAFDARLATPDFRVTSRWRSVFGERTAAETRTNLKELADMVASVRMWFSAVNWLSTTCCVFRQERKAVGRDGEEYSWTRLYTCEFRGGRGASMCEFELENEEAAFAYADELVAARPSRLAVATQTTESQRRWFQSVSRDGFESAPPPDINEHFQVVDRRAMPAAPCIGREAGIVGLRRLLADYPEVDVVTLAVRGESLALVEWRCRNPSGFEATYLNVHEFDAIGQVVVQVRFDGDDFEGAYRELEQRYYAGEGAAFAAGGAVWTDYVVGTNRRDFDGVFSGVVASDFHLKCRSRSAFGDRSAAEYRASLEELAAMVASFRGWVSAVHWLSPTICVVRTEREAVGLDGEAYSWTRVFTGEVRGGLLTAACEFELENEDEAFTYAEQLTADG